MFSLFLTGIRSIGNLTVLLMHFINLPVYESITLLRCRENKYSIAKEFFL